MKIGTNKKKAKWFCRGISWFGVRERIKTVNTPFKYTKAKTMDVHVCKKPLENAWVSTNKN